ncbi:MAG: metallophosphoesterase [Candidatus Edwardsbacteria bacterium]
MILLRKNIIKSVLICVNLWFLILSLAEAKFHFAIIGDNTGGHEPGILLQVLTEIERLNPDFVICVGDLIEGYSQNPKEIQAQWDTLQTILKILNEPFYFVPGNHDIQDEMSEKIYIKNTCVQPHYSFNYQNNHFIVLDNSRFESGEEISAEQWNWLKDDLEKNKNAENVFCFFHKPFWAEALEQKKNTEKWHELFKQYGVKGVFSGHWHSYFRTFWDGINYTAVGSSGASLKEDLPRGKFYQFLWVTVDGKSVQITPIKLGNIFSSDILTFYEREEIKFIESTSLEISPITLPEKGKDNRFSFTVKIKNLRDTLLEGELKCEQINPAWTITPTQAKYSLAPGAEMPLHFLATLKDNSLLYPLPSFTTEYPYGKDKVCKMEKRLFVHKIGSCSKVGKPPVIDGLLDDNCWGKIKPLKTFGAMDGSVTKVEPTEIYLGYDEQNLYIAARCYESHPEKIKTEAAKRDELTIAGDDYLWFFFDADSDQKTYDQLIVNANGIIFDRRCKFEQGKSTKDIIWNGNWQIKTVKTNKDWTLELSIPLNNLTETGKLAKTWGMNIRRLQNSTVDYADWQPTVEHNPTKFGELIFK